MNNVATNRKLPLLRKTAPSAPSFLRILRERRKVSRIELSKRTKLSAYQVEGLEGKSTENLMSRLLVCVNALGYKIDDLLDLIENHARQKDIICSKGTLGKPGSEIMLQDGGKLLIYIESEDTFMGQLQLAPGKRLGREKLPITDMVLGIVREGTLFIDALTSQSIHKKDQYFILQGNVPFEFVNACPYTQASILLFALKNTLKEPIV